MPDVEHPARNAALPDGRKWRGLRRTAGIVAAAVSFFAVAPAIANAAGAHLPNPVLSALSATGTAVSSVFAADDAGDEVKPCVEPTGEPSVEPTGEPSVEPTGEPSVEPTGEASDDASTDECEETAEPEATKSATAEAEDGADDAEPEHGQIVSTVAHCAPHGHDPLVAEWGNHGSAVRAAAHGESLHTPAGDFDLSTLAGATAYCTAVDAAAASATPAAKPSHGKSGEQHGNAGGGHGKPEKAAKPHPKPTGAGDDETAESDG